MLHAKNYTTERDFLLLLWRRGKTQSTGYDVGSTSNFLNIPFHCEFNSLYKSSSKQKNKS